MSIAKSAKFPIPVSLKISRNLKGFLLLSLVRVGGFKNGRIRKDWASLLVLSATSQLHEQKQTQHKRYHGVNNYAQGMKLIFFSDSHLAPKFFKVVAKWKKVGCHFQRQTKPSFKLSAF